MGSHFWVCDVPEQVALRIRARAEANHHSVQDELRAILIAAMGDAPSTTVERGFDDALRRWRGVFPKAAAGAKAVAEIVGARVETNADAAAGKRQGE